MAAELCFSKVKPTEQVSSALGGCRSQVLVGCTGSSCLLRVLPGFLCSPSVGEWQSPGSERVAQLRPARHVPSKACAQLPPPPACLVISSPSAATSELHDGCPWVALVSLGHKECGQEQALQIQLSGSEWRSPHSVMCVGGANCFQVWPIVYSFENWTAACMGLPLTGEFRGFMNPFKNILKSSLKGV